MENSALAECHEANASFARPTGLSMIGLTVTFLSVAITSLFFIWQGSVENQTIRLALIAAATLTVFLSLHDLVHEKHDTLSHLQRIVAFCRYTAILTVVSFTLLGHLDGISYLSCILSSAFVAMLFGGEIARNFKNLLK